MKIPREVVPGENRWFPFVVGVIRRFVPERRGVYLIAGPDTDPVYAEESEDLRDALRKHAEGESEQAACIRSHGAHRFLFTVVKGLRSYREGELQELLDFYEPSCNDGISAINDES